MIEDAKKVRWSDTEFLAVARRFVLRDRHAKTSAENIAAAMDALPEERRRKNLHGVFLTRMRKLIKQVMAETPEIEDRFDSTSDLRDAGVLRDPRNGRVEFVDEAPPVIPAPVALPGSPRVMTTPPTALAPPPRPAPASSVADTTSVLETLIALNRLVLRLNECDLRTLLAADPLDAKRLQSLTIQCSNGLTMFEELCAAARRY